MTGVQTCALPISRDNLNKLEDKSFLDSFIKQYPLDIQEVFSANAKGALPADVMAKLNEQERIILGTPPPIEKCNLSKDINEKMQVTPVQNGKILILERYNPLHKYICGMDPIPFVSSKLNDGSDNCIVVKNVDTNRYVAFYKERALDPDIIMHNNILLQDYYGKAKVMIEVNRGGVILDHYKQRNRLDLLAPRPSLLGKVFISGERSFGWYKNDHTGERANSYIIDYFRKYWDSVYFMDIIEEAKLYLVDNTDIIDAMVSAEIYHRQIIEKGKRDTGPELEVKKIPVIEMIDGRAIRVWKEIRVERQ